ncbi:4Fe-4S dicluster domain-containing protein [Dehalogenimonas etheniformans]|uniref:4Fe-4S ferredoxin n=1 Tax=Dehalogenimonas etheniformans TaxID=1536648 RepID=A0A2P5P6M2_9CHLR|nr:4Fe-4S ferredoxin [Dehalogenimonas etheniformans]QNT75295.1 4Fe-4S binding protein [Dehalogenimonas etheniformans]
MVDRTRCEGGFHNECKENRMPCLAACTNSVLEVRALSGNDKVGLRFGVRLRIWVHKNRQAVVVNPGVCDGCGDCVKACPVHAVKCSAPDTGVCSTLAKTNIKRHNIFHYV